MTVSKAQIRELALKMWASNSPERPLINRHGEVTVSIVGPSGARGRIRVGTVEELKGIFLEDLGYGL